MITTAALAMDIGGSHVMAALVDLERREVIEASRAHRAVNPVAPADELLAQWAGVGLDAASARVRSAALPRWPGGLLTGTRRPGMSIPNWGCIWLRYWSPGWVFGFAAALIAIVLMTV